MQQNLQRPSPQSDSSFTVCKALQNAFQQMLSNIKQRNFHQNSFGEYLLSGRYTATAEVKGLNNRYEQNRSAETEDNYSSLATH